MAANCSLSEKELGSLKEVAKGAWQEPISIADGKRLLELTLVYNLLGCLRITTAGRARIAGDVSAR
jgi:hypothetical protein